MNVFRIFFYRNLQNETLLSTMTFFLQSFLEMKMTDFDTEVQSMNRWMNDSKKLVNSLHVGMDPNEVSKRVQQIKVRDLRLCPCPFQRCDRTSPPIKIGWESLL